MIAPSRPFHSQASTVQRSAASATLSGTAKPNRKETETQGKSGKSGPESLAPVVQTPYFWRALRTRSLVKVRGKSTLKSANSGCRRESVRSAVAGPSSGMDPLVE